MKLIDKDSLLEKLSTFHPDYTFNITTFRNFVKAQPEVDAVPVKHGRWIDLKCSECGTVDMSKPNYCPTCGARMEESDG